MDNNIITVKASRGLNSIVSGNGETVSANLYTQKEKKRDGDGTFVAAYNNKPFPGSKKYFAPKWDALRKQWPWGGDNITFSEVVNGLRLRYPKNHSKSGELIVPGEVKEHQKDFKDAIFHHPDLISKCFIEGGTGTLNLDIPIEAFMYYCNRSHRDIVDETANTGKLVSPSMRSSATMIFSNPSRAAAKNHKKANTFLSALNVLIENQTNLDKLRVFVELFNIPGLSKSSELSEIVPTLTEFIKEQGETVQKGTGYSSVNEALIAYNKMTDDELEHRFVIKMAKKRGHIRTAKNGFLLLGKLIEGPRSQDDIYLYFTSGGEVVTEQFVELLDKMRELREID